MALTVWCSITLVLVTASTTYLFSVNSKTLSFSEHEQRYGQVLHFSGMCTFTSSGSWWIFYSLLYDLSVHLSFYLFSLSGFCFYLLSYSHHLMVVLSCCVNPCSVVVAALLCFPASLLLFPVSWNSSWLFIILRHNSIEHDYHHFDDGWQREYKHRKNLLEPFLLALCKSALHSVLTRWNPLNHLHFSTSVIIPTAIFCISDSSVSTWWNISKRYATIF